MQKFIIGTIMTLAMLMTAQVFADTQPVYTDTGGSLRAESPASSSAGSNAAPGQMQPPSPTQEPSQVQQPSQMQQPTPPQPSAGIKVELPPVPSSPANGSNNGQPAGGSPRQ